MTKKTSSAYKQETKQLFETSDLAESYGKYRVPKSDKRLKPTPKVKKEIIANSVPVEAVIADEMEDTMQDPFASRLQEA